MPEWQRTLDAVLGLPPEIGGRVGVSGGVIAMGVRLALVDSRIAAAGLFAGSFVPPRTTLAEARRVRIPLHVLLQWDDEGNDRGRALELFDAFGSPEKTLYANMGGHTGVPAFAGGRTLPGSSRGTWAVAEPACSGAELSTEENRSQRCELSA